jgi:hypothetical protein
MTPPAALVPQDPRRGEHRRETSDEDEHMAEINVIFGGSMSITLRHKEEASARDQLGPANRARKTDEVVR